MTRIELGSPSISQKKHIIGYWVSDDKNVKLDCFDIDNNSTVCIWAEQGTFNDLYLFVHIIEDAGYPSSGKTEYTIATVTEHDEWSNTLISDSKLNELDLVVKLEDGEHPIKLHRTK